MLPIRLRAPITISRSMGVAAACIGLLAAGICLREWGFPSFSGWNRSVFAVGSRVAPITEVVTVIGDVKDGLIVLPAGTLCSVDRDPADELADHAHLVDARVIDGPWQGARTVMRRVDLGAR